MTKGIKIGCLVIIGLILLPVGIFFLRGCGTASKMVDDGFTTIEKQFSPSQLLKKYEWFKDASAQCDQKLATLKTYETRFVSMRNSYGADSLNRRVWSRGDKEQYNIWESEYLGVKASYNDLAATYNAQMAKFNYAFCNVGSLPQGATEPLPREYKPYITE